MGPKVEAACDFVQQQAVHVGPDSHVVDADTGERLQVRRDPVEKQVGPKRAGSRNAVADVDDARRHGGPPRLQVSYVRAEHRVTRAAVLASGGTGLCALGG